MANDVIAIRGFDYQATVILAELFDHFERHGPNATVRPEGLDDLDLHWIEGTEARCRHVQMKKPREDRDGNRKPAPWTLSETISELLPNTIAHLSGNNSEQVWVLGDEVKSEVRSLVEAGQSAPLLAPEPYWRTIHTLARNAALSETKLDASIQQKLARARLGDEIPTDPVAALVKIERDFGELAKNAGASGDVADQYHQRAIEFHSRLPDVLARTTIRSTYGSEEEVTARIHDRLASTYSLSRPVVEQTLFRNLRGFINDISKQPGRKFDRVEFELELRSVWPQMVPIKSPPSLPPNYVSRRDLTEQFTTGWAGRAIEIVGISGSGKTMLASEVMRQSEVFDPDRAVYYAEVRGETSLRDVLIGVAFHLRRFGVSQLFATSVESGPSEEDMLAQLARSFSSLQQKTLLLIDLVEGTCTPTFARDLGIFVRGLSSSSQCRMALFGQESALRQLDVLERERCEVRRLDIRGFSFEEFVVLVSHDHPNPDRAVLWEIYQRVTAGRAAGLFAQLAGALAAAPSLQDMQGMAAKPPDEILPFAERQRFARVSGRSRSAAEKLLCFALPFEQAVAEQIFPDDNIGSAIKELLELGLLRLRSDGSFEMHEIVRAGLEGLIALNLRNAAHQQLAAWYRKYGPVTASILHLDKAGMHDAAKVLARETVLRGEDWGALAVYVERHKLVSPNEVIQAIAGTRQVDDGYLLSDILRRLGEPVAVESLIQILREQCERFCNDYQWASAIVGAILEFEPARLDDLLNFVLEGKDDLPRMEAALAWLRIGARRHKVAIEPKTIELFERQRADIKRMLVPFLLLDWRREVLRPALQFLVADVELVDDRRKSPFSRDLSLQVRSVADTVEFLAALPSVKPAAMLIAKSALLGPLAGPVWAERKALRAHCIEIIEDTNSEDMVLEGAIRILIYLAEPSICALCDPLLSRSQAVRSLAELVPALVPSSCDRLQYEKRVLNRDANMQERVSALSVLALVGADLGAIYRALRAAGEDTGVWDTWFVMLCGQSPFPDAIPIIEEYLATIDDAQTGIVTSALMKLGELPIPAATTMLIGALPHGNLGIRRCAAAGLQQRRARGALASLIERYKMEQDELLVATLAAAIVSSGARSVADLGGRENDSSNVKLWQCILAARVRDESYAEQLVAIACNFALSWQLRRAAIFAAGKIPYEMALQRIQTAVLAETSPLTIDESLALGCHEIISSVLLTGAQGMLGIFAEGEAKFIQFFGEIFDEIWHGSEGLPTGRYAASWLFARLTHHGWPTNNNAPDVVINELHVPLLRVAVLRSLRLLGRPDLIEEQIPNADCAWFVMKCLLERFRAGARDPQLATRLKSLLDSSPYRDNLRLNRVIEEMGVSVARAAGVDHSGGDQATIEPAISRVGYAEIVRAMSDPNYEFKPAPPLVLETVTPQEYAHLVQLAAPINDRSNSIETFLPSVHFTRTGHLASRRTVTTTGGGDPVRGLIRPAIAAANLTGLPIAWHEELITGVFATTYVPMFIACLGARGDSSRFYEELGASADLLLPYLGRTAHATPIMKFIDARIVPFLSRYASTGTDELFEGLSTLALRVTTPEIDLVLATLFYRWTQRFDLNSPYPQHDQNYNLWRGFGRLTEHPRFGLIDGWQPRLAAVIRARMSWYHRETIARVLERDPRSYVQIEALLLRATNWEHFHHDEIDRLDAAAEKLFTCTVET